MNDSDQSAPRSKTVYFVRHGESIDNTRPFFPDDANPLSERGMIQAQAAAERVSHIEFKTLLSSPLQRARQTAEQIGLKAGKDVEYSELFIERVKPSAIAGKSWQDPAADELFRAWKQSLFTSDRRVADGENYADLVGRADKTIDFLTARTEQSLVVVTHGFFLNTIVAWILTGSGLTPEILDTFQVRAMLDNAGLTVLRYVHDYHHGEFAWRLCGYNDHAYIV